MDIDKIVHAPIFFKRNRVYRIYTGGKLFHDFFGDANEDTLFPEEWIASTVKTIKKNRPANEGLSIVDGTDIIFADLVKEKKNEILGENRDSFGILVKALDSAIRLPIQVHPDKPFSRKYFNSDYGKTESWVILAVRENPKIYFGFKDKISREDFLKLIDESEKNPEAFTPYLNAVTPKVGDVFLIHAKMIHAIGAGCMILEVQEPSDFTIQVEAWCVNYKVSDAEKYLGLEKETALECFDFDTYGDDATAKSRITPKVIFDKNGIKKESLISYENTPCFAVNRYTLTDAKITLEEAPAIYLVTQGSGQIEWNSGEGKRDISKGNYFLIPHCIKGQVSVSGNIEIAECLPPQEVKK